MNRISPFVVKVVRFSTATAGIPKVASGTVLLQNFRTKWPEVSNIKLTEKIDLPERTIPDELLKFEMSATYDQGSSLFYPHMKMNPADFKVILRTNILDLKLSPNQSKILIEMLGARYNVGKQEIKLTASRFPNRIENKRYVVYLLENLLRESKRVCELIEKEQKV